MATKSTVAERPRVAAEPGRLTLVCVLAWLVPGAGHLFEEPGALDHVCNLAVRWFGAHLPAPASRRTPSEAGR